MPARLDRAGRDWERWLRTPLTREDRDAVEGWRRRGLPLVVARRQPADAADDLRLGLSLPDKRRIGVHVASSAAVTHAGPPALAAVLASAPAAWWPRWPRCCWPPMRSACRSTCSAHSRGSTGRARNTCAPVPTSTCCSPRVAGREVERLLAELQSLCGPGAVPRLDGEVLLPDGGAVAWRELAARPARLMVKGPRDVALRDYAAVAALFSEFPA